MREIFEYFRFSEYNAQGTPHIFNENDFLGTIQIKKTKVKKFSGPRPYPEKDDQAVYGHLGHNALLSGLGLIQ